MEARCELDHAGRPVPRTVRAHRVGHDAERTERAVRVALDVRFDAVTPAIGTDGQGGRRAEVGAGGRRGGHGRKGAFRAGRPMDRKA